MKAKRKMTGEHIVKLVNLLLGLAVHHLDDLLTARQVLVAALDLAL